MTDSNDRDARQKTSNVDLDDDWAPSPEPLPPSRGVGSPRPRDGAPPDANWLDALLQKEASEREPRRADIGAPQARSGQLDFGSLGTSDGLSDETFAGGQRDGVERCSVGLCKFRIRSHCFALDIGLVGEVVRVERVVEVPSTPPAFVGLFNLRGTPMALIDLARVLELGAHVASEAAPEGQGRLALVLRFTGITVGALIDEMQEVVAAGQEGLIRAEAGDNPLVLGFLTRRGATRETVTVLSSDVLMERFASLKFTARSVQA